MLSFNERELLIINSHIHNGGVVDSVQQILSFSNGDLVGNVSQFSGNLLSNPSLYEDLYCYVFGEQGGHQFEYNEIGVYKLLKALCKKDCFKFEYDVDDRFLNFAFAYCSLCDFSDYADGKFRFLNISIERSSYLMNRDNFQGGSVVLSKKDKVKAINVFLLFIESHNGGSGDILFSLNETWRNVVANCKIINWLNKNEVLLDWAYDYIAKTFLNKRLPSWMQIADIEKNKATSKKREIIINFFDVLSPADQMIVWLKMRNAGTQQKHRIKSGLDDSDRKKIQIPMRMEVKNKLKRLSERDDKCLYEVIEELIEGAYEKRFGPR
ncbi:MAG TPA: hypothetical protein DCF88_04390 [Plesiomonas shigelloides]|nr:hypothetical protein [Plesiomonas shigelloides]